MLRLLDWSIKYEVLAGNLVRKLTVRMRWSRCNESVKV